ncbi:MAG: aminopeptidase P family N-terminal domain-containing protein, partial [Verrucomicrobiae bacterium]|nr:aminopeptidase P family N-terminal domain-containing protein [Verrucomicrobiae bacterium]
MSDSNKPQLTLEGCRSRQRRLRERMAALGVERAVVVTREHVQWLTGFRPHWLMSAAAVLDLEGDCTLIAPNSEPEFHAADQVATFPMQWQATLRMEAMQAIAEAMGQAVDRGDAVV